MVCLVHKRPSFFLFSFCDVSLILILFHVFFPNVSVTAGIPTLKSTFNVTLSGRNFGKMGEVLRFDGWCNASLNERCGTGAIRTCLPGTSLVATPGGGNAPTSDDPVLCGWNIIPGMHQPFNPLIGGVFSYTNTDVEMTFKGLRGTVIIRRGGRLSQIRRTEFRAQPPPYERFHGGYDWTRACTTPARGPAVVRSFNTSFVGQAVDPGAMGGSGSQYYMDSECDMGQSSNNASFSALSPYITHMEGRVSVFDALGHKIGTSNELNFPTMGHNLSSQESIPGESVLILKCWYCISQSAKIFIGGDSIKGKIVGGSRCTFDATADNLEDPEFLDQPEKQAAIYSCHMPPGQGYEQPVWIVTDSGPSGKKGKMGPNVVRFIAPTINDKHVLDMEGKPLCDGILPANLCRRVPTRGLDVKVVGENLGLYGQIIFKDGRLNTCENSSFACCTGAYDNGLTSIVNSTKCNDVSGGIFSNQQGHRCKPNDLGCSCRSHPSCSVRPDALRINYRHCVDDDDGMTRGCICTSVSKHLKQIVKNCQKCGVGDRINREGLCVNAFGQSEATADVATAWDHKSVAFQLPSGIGVGHQVEISISGQTDDTVLFDYEPPTIESIEPLTGPTVGYTAENEAIITIRGKNFGDHDAQVHMGNGQECEGDNTKIGPDVCLYRCEIVDQDHEVIKIKLPAGIGFDLPLRVKVGGQVSNTDVTFNYSAPIIREVYPLNGRTDGLKHLPTGAMDETGAVIKTPPQLITVLGEHFGTVPGRDKTILFGRSKIISVPVFSNDTMLQFNLPARTGKNHKVEIEVGGQVSTSISEYIFNYDAPIVYPIKMSNWTQQRGNSNFPGENGRYYAPTTGCANPASEMDEVADPENPPSKRGCISAAHVIIKGENFGCCTHSAREIDIYGAFASDCKGRTINGVTINNGPPCSLQVTSKNGVTQYINHPQWTPRLVLTDENGLVQEMKVKSFGHYEIKAELPEGTGRAVISVEVGPKGESSTTYKSQYKSNYKTAGTIGFSYSKPALRETKFGFEISGADISNSFDATGSSKYGTLDGEKDTQWKLFLFGDNFGASQSPTHIKVLAGYFNNGDEDWKNCSEPTWHRASFHSAGFPYLSCYPPPVTVGRKQFRITIGSNTQLIRNTIHGRPVMGKCPPNFYGLTDEYCVACWNYKTDAAPDSPIMLANCSGIYDASIQVWREGKQVTVGGTVEPVARFGYSIWPPKECASGECLKRSYKGLLPQESGISLVPDSKVLAKNNQKQQSCLPYWDEEKKDWVLPSMICDAATKAGDTCHPLRAYGKYSMTPDDKFEHQDRNLHAWPPHKGHPPTDRMNCIKHGGIWAASAITDGKFGCRCSVSWGPFFFFF